MKATATSPATRSREWATSFVECHIIGFIRREIGVRVTRRQLWQLLHLFFAFTVFLLAATSGSWCSRWAHWPIARPVTVLCLTF